MLLAVMRMLFPPGAACHGGADPCYKRGQGRPEMKLVTFAKNGGGERVGALIGGDRIVDLAAGWAAVNRGRPAPHLASMLALIEAADAAFDDTRRALDAIERAEPDGAILPRAAVRLLAPVPVPAQMRDALCFEKHLKQAYASIARMKAAREADPAAAAARLAAQGVRIPEVWYHQPIYYKCNRFAVVGPDADVVWPDYAGVLDYELEFGAFLKRRVKNATPAEARAAIFGYTIFNDVSARDAQAIEMEGGLGPAKGKDFDTGNVLGPCLVTADELKDPYALTMVARVNGEEWSRGTSADMHWTFEDVIAHASRSETLYPGEFIGSGTVGNGCGLEQGRYPQSGDTVELEVERIGVLRNRFVKPARAQ
jgi:2-keto-4-pentenoate hydratase/2-oxohepta-3-ene-1,7-dioic acid hydratase in catechol pathway